MAAVVTAMMAVVVGAAAVPSSGDGEGAAAVSALQRFRSGDVNGAVPMLEAAVKQDPLDWVSLQHIAAAYGMAARRLGANRVAGSRVSASAHVDGTSAFELLTPAEVHALNATAVYFERADRARTARAVVSATSGMSAEGSAGEEYPQEAFAAPLTLTLRGWGDVLTWMGRVDEARAVFRRGVEAGVWRTPLCRPSVDHPTSLPAGTFFLDAGAFSHVTDRLVSSLPVMRREMAAALVAGVKARDSGGWASQGWQLEAAGLHTSRSWHVLPLMINGKLQRGGGCRHWPETCSIIRKLVALRLRDGQVKVSMMLPGTVVRPHAGPTNARLRMHCPLIVPPEEHAARIRVGGEWKEWRDGHCIVFDESCEHEVRIDPAASTPRAVLIVDFANPFLTSEDAYLSTLVTRAAAKPAAIKQYRRFQRRLFGPPPTPTAPR